MRFRILVAALLASLAALPAAYADPGNGNGRGHNKVEKSLAAAAAANPDGDLHVLVFGSEPKEAARKHRGRDTTDIGLVSSVSTTVRGSDLDALASDDGVGYVAPDVPVAPLDYGLDPSRLATIYPKVDGAPNAWDQGLSGSGVGVAVIDSGVQDRADFGGDMVRVTLPGQTWSNRDTYGHGTLVAGIIAGQSARGDYVGVAPGVTVYSINVNRPDGVRSSDVITGLQWVFEHAHQYNIRVVNLSLAETQPSTYQLSLLDLAVERLWASGIVVAVAAGNGGLGMVDFAPANDPLAVTVGAADSNDTRDTSDDKVALFSSLGITLDGFAKPELYAPGRHIASTLGTDTTLWAQAPAVNKVGGAAGYASISGTSFAAPQVAAAAALLLQSHPDWSPDNVKWLLTARSRPLSGSSSGALALGAALNFYGSPGLANQGVPALVCPPGGKCIVDGVFGTVASSWNASSWNASSWNASSWNASSWNASSWNAFTWNASSWNASSWNASSWNASSWNAYTWN